MVHKTFLIIAMTLISSHLSLQQQNLCGTDGTRIWVNDPSSCHAYLWCNWRNGVLESVHQLDCRAQGSTFFRADPTGTSGVCTDNFPECVADPLTMCPAVGENEIMVANPEDANCREHRPCRLPGAQWGTCRDPLVFNRNTGTCDFAERAPCTPNGGAGPTGCPAGETGNFPGDTCYSFILCINGENSGRFTCGEGLKFDTIIGNCIEDPEGTCVRTTEIKRVKTVKTFSGWNKFLRAIHLY